MSLEDIVSDYHKLRNNYKTVPIEELDKIIVSHYEWLKDLNEEIMQHYLTHNRVCPMPIDLKPKFENVDAYIDLLLPNADMCDMYLKQCTFGYVADKIMKYCLLHGRVQNHVILSENFTEYCNLLADSGCDDLLFKYLQFHVEEKHSIDMNILSRKAKDLLFSKSNNTLFYFTPTEQIEYMQKADVHSLSLHRGIITDELKGVYCKLLAQDMDNLNIIAKPDWVTEYLLENVPEKLKQNLLGKTDLTINAKNYEANYLQKLLYRENVTTLNLVKGIMGDAIFEPVIQISNHYKSERQFVDVLMEHSLYQLLEHVHYVKQYDTAYTVAALSSISKPWALEVLKKVSVEAIRGTIEHFPKAKELVLPILEKRVLQNSVPDSKPYSVMKV